MSMKRQIIARSYNPVMSHLVFSSEFAFSVCHYPEYRQDADIILMHMPLMREIHEEVSLRMMNSGSYRIAVIQNGENSGILKSVFSGLDIIDAGDESEVEAGLRRIADGSEDLGCREQIHFSVSELQFLRFLSSGMSYKEIAAGMHMSDRSARRIKEKLLRKTGLFSLQQLLIYALFSDNISIRSY